MITQRTFVRQFCTKETMRAADFMKNSPLVEGQIASLTSVFALTTARQHKWWGLKKKICFNKISQTDKPWWMAEKDVTSIVVFRKQPHIPLEHFYWKALQNVWNGSDVIWVSYPRRRDEGCSQMVPHLKQACLCSSRCQAPQSDHYSGTLLKTVRGDKDVELFYELLEKHIQDERYLRRTSLPQCGISLRRSAQKHFRNEPARLAPLGMVRQTNKWRLRLL